MTAGGLARDRVGRIDAALARLVERGELAGAVALVARGPDLHVAAVGRQALDAPAPMRRDTIFRIASMTKPVVAVAALMLVEDGTLRLDDPVDPLLPELAGRPVLKRIDGWLDDTEPAARSITLRDLLTFRCGIGFVPSSPEAPSPLARAMAEAGVAPGPDAPPHGPDEMMRRYGSLPLAHQPGARWLYHGGAEILGVLIARATGTTLGSVLRARLFEPLGMRDTGFHVPADKLDRLATAYRADPATGALTVQDPAAGGRYAAPPVFESGGGGLVSTADDYLAFARLLMAQGRHAGRRLLSRAAVELMVTDQITPAEKALSPFFPGFWDVHGWGFGVAIDTRRDDLGRNPGRYGWDGGRGTSWRNDPRDGLTGILLTQRLWDSPRPPRAWRDFWTAAAQAPDD